jgi:hypothetical protein
VVLLLLIAAFSNRGSTTVDRVERVERTERHDDDIRRAG